MVKPCDNGESDDTSDREAVCRMCVCGIDTVMIMRRGGCGEGGAAPGTDSESAVLGRRTDLCL